MSKDQFERKAYRRGPGRQYDYDPLNSQNRNGSGSGSTQNRRGDASQAADRWPSNGEASRRTSGLLAPRPNPRRTRQLLRQSIIASKYQSTPLPEEGVGQDYGELDDEQYANEDEQLDYQTPEESSDDALYTNRYRVRYEGAPQAGAYRPTQLPPSRQYIETGEDEEADEWNDFDPVDPDIGYEDPFDQREVNAQNPPLRSPAPRRRIITRRLPEPRYDYPEEYDEYEEDEYVDEPEERPARPRPRSRPRPRRKSKKGGLTRRKLLVGAGVVAVGGLAAYELGPKIPQALHDAGTNIEHQIEDAYNKGLAAGAEAVRKEFIAALTNMEGISLTGATNAARLTRLAYDAFVSPVVNLAATVTGDFLNITLRTLIQGRGWLARINQDNDTLAALQTVLETWSKRVKEVPKEWQTIADSDLDAAQAYLRALQRKIQEEQAKVNNPQSGIPTNVPKAPGTPTH
ncbi:MAG: hypothetical protein E6J48_11525 [Chloroflexi bacterium]|nr:MAG: hypothetical protein E6J48_11525 [Chloroflexota bacterium]